MKPGRQLKRKGQKGISLLAVAIALAVVSVITVGLTRGKLTRVEQSAGATFGYSVNQVSQAVDNYRGSNLATLVTANPVVPGVANPMAPTIAELQATGYLSGSVAAGLPDGNTYRITLAKNPPGCIGPSVTCNPYSILSLVNPIVDIETGKPSITRLSALIDAIQDSASYSALPNPAQITGGNGGWTVANPDPANREGILVVVAGLGGTGTQWLRVGDPRDPMFMNNMTVFGYIKPSNGPGQTVVAGTACTEPSGAIKNDAAGRVLSCQNGIWTATDGAKAVIQRGPISDVPGGQTFTLDVCPPGGTPWASYVGQISAGNVTVIPPYQVLSYSFFQSGGNWVTLTRATRPPAAPVTVNADGAILGVVPLGTFTSGCSY